MNPSHYPSLELCKKLTEIGFPTTFQHIGDSGGTVIGCGEIPEGLYVSPSIAEMLDVIPIPLHHKIEIEKQYDFDDGYWYKVCFHSRDSLLKGFQDELLPNALAEMILWLHENNYISFTE